MKSRCKLALIPCISEEGLKLVERIRGLARDLEMDIAVLDNRGPIGTLVECLYLYDVVIFDATVETGNSYGKLSIQVMTRDYLLVVGRTHLPLNFSPARIAGLPQDPEERGWDNARIEAWLAVQLKELKADHAVGRLKRIWFGMRKSKKSYDYRQERYRSEGQIFISFHFERDTPAFLDGPLSLKKRIESGEFHGGVPKTVHYFRPGSLSSELMTEQRRWMISGFLRDRLAAADEIWIYDSENYSRSWWAQVELLTAAHEERPWETVKTWSVRKGRLEESSLEVLPAMSHDQRKRIARWFANCTPGIMGPEDTLRNRAMRQVPGSEAVEYLHNHVWSEEFWDHPVLDCRSCRLRMQKERLGVDEILWLRGDHFTRITPREMSAWLDLGYIECEVCAAKFQIRESQRPQYLWLPTGYATELCRQARAQYWRPFDENLVALPTYILL